jgi:hypothetical protein
VKYRSNIVAQSFVQARSVGEGEKGRAFIMFEEMTNSSVHLLLIIFGLILFFIIVYGALSVRASKQIKA